MLIMVITPTFINFFNYFILFNAILIIKKLLQYNFNKMFYKNSRKYLKPFNTEMVNYRLFFNYKQLFL